MEWFDNDSFWIDQYSIVFSDQRFAEAADQTEKLAAQAGFRVTGVDRTVFLLEKGRARARAVEDREDDLTVLRHMLRNLRPGGVCVIDLKGKEGVARTLQPTSAEIRRDGTIVVKRCWVVDDWTRVRTEVIEIREGERRTFNFDVTLYSGQELRDRLQSVGFRDIKLYGSLTGGEYGFDAERLIAVARKGSGAP